MLAALQRWAPRGGLRGYASLEAHMACGSGACQGCVVATDAATRASAVDGPVFALRRGAVVSADRGAARARPDLRVALGSLELEHPLINASGTFDAARVRARFGGDALDRSRSPPTCPRPSPLEPRTGNPPPRVTETPSGMINAIGLANKGIDALPRRPGRLARRSAADHRQRGRPQPDDYVEVVRRSRRTCARRPATVRPSPATSSTSRVPTWPAACRSAPTRPRPRP